MPLLSDQNGEPCIPIVKDGWHAVILKKACWHEESDGTPYVDDVCIYDPDYNYPWSNKHFSIEYFMDLQRWEESSLSQSCFFLR